MNPNRFTSRHIILKMAKVKERILNAAREKQRVSYKGTSIRLSDDFSIETLQARRSGIIYSKSRKGKTFNLGYYTQQNYHLV